jgi:hypothetical protein
VSEWLAVGGVQLPATVVYLDARNAVQKQDPEWYHAKPEDPPRVSIISPSTVKVTAKDEEIEKWRFQRSAKRCRVPGLEVKYRIDITNESKGQEASLAQGVYIVVSDKRDQAHAVPQQVKGTLVTGDKEETVFGLRQEAETGKPESLLWVLGDIPPHGTSLLTYSIRFQTTFSILNGPAELANVKGPDAAKIWTFDVLPKAKSYPADIVLAVWTLNTEQLPKKIFGPNGLKTDGKHFVIPQEGERKAELAVGTWRISLEDSSTLQFRMFLARVN